MIIKIIIIIIPNDKNIGEKKYNYSENRY